MLLLVCLYAGLVAAIVPDSSLADISQNDVFSVVCLFMLLSLTFSVSFFGVKRLMEKSPKLTSSIHPPTTYSHETIAF
ncbi:hypothetical protein NEHOM01_0002 [Nematocida homosporus]|uniref:uncharacterized protein n=1 Tax=Nematocida homosporus TaxID=1912981 RepID=UPI00221F1737|nr:uncharacterized protein NEHOM01_0002 [Nematocida homosporus]KAI5184257.1 hypothetical protein NEHOM01_0002 [Nematocida homosporus]